MPMIQDVDESLRALVKRDALNGSKADVAFDAPNKEWSSRRNTPTVDLYLYDIREDLEQREVMWEDIRGDPRDSRLVTERRPPPRRFKLSYLVTAWTQRPEDEHRLLSSLLLCFLRHPTMPADALSGALANASQPVLLNIAQPPPQDRSISDVWSALGGELKPSLDLVVNAPFEVRVAVPAGPPVLEEPRFTFARPDGESEEGGEAAARSGRARRAAAAQVAEGAKPVGAPGPAGPRASGRLKPGEPVAKPGVQADQEEMVRSGKEKQPGRILRIRGINRS
jgi:Pvc16 N-terminal domain